MRPGEPAPGAFSDSCSAPERFGGEASASLSAIGAVQGRVEGERAAAPASAPCSGPASARGGERLAPRILIVEDDAAISDVVRTCLEGEGYAPSCAFSGTEAELLCQERVPFDLVICDLMLPGAAGEDVIAHIRALSDVPIIVTSARAAVADRVALLRIGADDYLVKPFDLDELAARAEAALRRSAMRAAAQAGAVGASAGAHAGASAKAGFSGIGVPSDASGVGMSGAAMPPDPPALRFGAWEADEASRAFTAAGAPIRLTRTEFDIVCALMRRPKKVFTKRELFELVWCEQAAVEEKTVNTHVSNIRAKLKRAGAPDYIETVWGIGFKLAEEAGQANGASA